MQKVGQFSMLIDKCKRPGPVGAMPDADLVCEITRLIEESPFHGEGYRKMWARLRQKGVFTSKSLTQKYLSIDNTLRSCVLEF